MTTAGEGAETLRAAAVACSCGHDWDRHGYSCGGCAECRCSDCGGDHPGRHSRANRCPDCGKFSWHSWATQPMYTPDGYHERWGGICRDHGDWSDSA